VLVTYCSGGVWVVYLWGLCSYSGVEIAAYDGGKLGLGMVDDVFYKGSGLYFGYASAF
jgi:hypothetical protein